MSYFYKRILLMLMLTLVLALNLLSIPLVDIPLHLSHGLSVLISAFVIGPISAWTAMWAYPKPKGEKQ